MKNCKCLAAMLVLGGVLLLILPSTCRATTRYVNPDGMCNGSTPCYATIQAAIDASAAGDVIMVQPGVYTPSAKIDIHTSVKIFGAQTGVNPLPSKGTPRMPGDVSESIVDGGPGGLSGIVVITADDVLLDGLEFRNCTGDIIDTETSIPTARVQISNCIIHDSSGDEGIQLRNVAAPVIGCNHIFNTGGDGINVCCGSTDAVIKFNEVHDIDSPDAAIYVYGSSNTTIKGNLVYNTTQNDGIKLGSKDGSDGAGFGGLIFNNTTHHTAQDGISVYMSDTDVMCNDVSYSTSENGAIYVDWGAANVNIEHNWIHDNTLDVGKWGDPGGVMINPSVDASMVVVTDNSIYNNTPNGMTNKSTALLVAHNNWWGAADGPSGAGPGSGDAISTNIDPAGWKHSPPGKDCPPIGECPAGYVPVLPTSWGAVKSMYR